LAAWVAFWLDVALILIARKRINHYTNGAFSAHIGNAFWLSLAGAVRHPFPLIYLSLTTGFYSFA
jgi:hypothetical protein